MKVQLVQGPVQPPRLSLTRGQAGALSPQVVAIIESTVERIMRQQVHAWDVDFAGYMAALVEKESRHDYDFKESKRIQQEHGAMLFDQAKRIRAIEENRVPKSLRELAQRIAQLEKGMRAIMQFCNMELLKKAGLLAAPGGDKRENARPDDLYSYENRPRPMIGPVPDYSRLRADAADKAGKELPESISTAGLAKYFGVSRNTVWNMAKRGLLHVQRRGRLYDFPRAEVVQYIRHHGLPKRGSFYGTGGITEVSE